MGSHPFGAGVPSHPNSRRSHREPGDRGRTKARAGSLTHSPARGDDRCKPARALGGGRAAAGVGFCGRSDGRLRGWTGSERRAGDPARRRRWRAAASGGRERTEPEGGRAALDWESSPQSNFHALICMSFAWSSRNGPDTLPATPTPAVPGTPASDPVQTACYPAPPKSLPARATTPVFKFYFYISWKYSQHRTKEHHILEN